MHSAKQPVSVGRPSDSVREAAFDCEMVVAHRLADKTKKRQLSHRWRLGQIFAGESRPWHTQRMIYDDLIDSGCDDEKVLALAENHPLYVKRRLAEKRTLPSPAQALRQVVKEVGEALTAQLAADQNPTPENKQRAELETRDVTRVQETYLMSLYHRVEHVCQNALGNSGQRVWR